MKMWSLRAKSVLSVGLIIFLVLGISTVVHIYNLRTYYLETINLRSEALAQNLRSDILGKLAFQKDTILSQKDPSAIQMFLEASILQCIKIYEFNKEKNISFVAVVNASGVISAHNDRNMWNVPVESSVLLDALKRHKQITILDGEIYHTLVPIFLSKDDDSNETVYLGTIDIGTPRQVVDEKVDKIILHSLVLLGFFLVTVFFTVSVLIHVVITKPIRQIVDLAQQLASGRLVRLSQHQGRGNEIAELRTAFSNISAYLQDMMTVASQIAKGIITNEVRIRSDQDVLGKSVQEMLFYLKHVATVAKRVAEGNLTESVRVRSTEDAFGQVLKSMTDGLRSLIVRIRSSAEQIASTGQTISSLANHDIEIVKRVHSSAEEMVSTMNEMGASIEEVAHNMDTLSSSVEETSASVSQMASSITHIASKAKNLTSQTHQTITFLNDTVTSLEKVVKNTDESKNLSQETIKDSLKGQDAVEQVISSVETIQQAITTAVDSINRFAERSRDIDTILDVIRNITEQTSLLALNASIIAAQAGAHGRGFAVVADEIRNLASGVEVSTKDIATIVQTLQQDTNNVVRTIHEGASNVAQGMERTQQAREALQKITRSAERSSSLVTQISETLHDLMVAARQVSTAMEQVNIMTDDITLATNEQETSTGQINKAISHINEMTLQIQQATAEQLTGVQRLLTITNDVTALIEQNLESSQHITHTTTDLESQADLLVNSVDRFKLAT